MWKLCLALPCAVVLAAQETEPGLTVAQAVAQALEKYGAVKVSAEQVTAAAHGVQLARTSFLPQADLLMQLNRATRNNVFRHAAAPVRDRTHFRTTAGG